MSSAKELFFHSTEAARPTRSIQAPDRPAPAQPGKRSAPRSLKRTLSSDLNHLAKLAANLTEAYTAAIYRADSASHTLELVGAQTLSREFLFDAKIPYGSGLIGWTAENALRISVCPFDRDATTLLCYGADQGLKSFIAIPILSATEELLGVLFCDSKKKYAFAKLTEKILIDCAAQAAAVMELHTQIQVDAREERAEPAKLDCVIEQFRGQKDERSLMTLAAALPEELIDRAALVVVTTEELGVGTGAYYSSSPDSPMGHHLLELVCRHKKVICAQRRVLVMPTNDEQKRSFLSVPFKVLGREAGSFNLLSRPHESFEAGQVENLERLAAVLGSELERIRLRKAVGGSLQTNGINSWELFEVQARYRIEEAARNKTPLSLVRISLQNLTDLEDVAGIDAAVSVMQRVMRLVEQVKRQSALSCYLYGFQILVLTETAEVERTVSRFERLLERVTVDELVPGNRRSGLRFGSLLVGGTNVVSARFPQDGETLEALLARTLRALDRVRTEGRSAARVGATLSWDDVLVEDSQWKISK